MWRGTTYAVSVTTHCAFDDNTEERSWQLMAFTDPRYPPTEDTHTENVQDVIPPTERGQDPELTELTHGLTLETSRPLTDDERKAADRDAPVGQRVYAPASERVPVDPVPGHRDFVEHPDIHTAEREAAGNQSGEGSEATFARVPRPSTPPAVDPYASSATNTAWDTSTSASGSSRAKWLGMSVGWLTLGLCSGIGIWLWLRWQRERNKPINRLKRQARQAAEEIRDRVPSPEQAARPAMGLTTAILSILLLWWQQSQSRARPADKLLSRHADRAARRATEAARTATETVSDLDWQKRLIRLKNRWTPGRVELEKVSISRR